MPSLPLLTALVVLLCAGSVGIEESPRDRAVELARTRLIDAKELSAGDVTIRKVREVDWPDTSLGCPEEGKSYAQVITPGFVVFLDAEGALYSVHVGDGRAVVCERDQRGVPRATKTARGDVFRGFNSARRELAAELEIDESEIRIRSLERIRWTDAAGCCIPDLEASEESPVDGAVLTFGVGDELFVVHLAGERTARCPAADAAGGKP